MTAPDPTRRTLLRSAAALAAGAALPGAARAAERTLERAPTVLSRRTIDPVFVASSNGHKACTERAMEVLLSGRPIVEAVVEGVGLIEEDPKDHSVGLGGLPNENGIVQLDASVMDGSTGRSGAVGCIEDTLHPAQVALRVLRHTDHCLIVGDDAKSFARAHGFPHHELLTDAARRMWMYWKGHISERDNWYPDEDSVPEGLKGWLKSTGTINCCGVDAEGRLAGTTTTSGLAFKIPGRVGDSPIVGAGLYVDGDFGAAGSTGRGEANIVSCGSFRVVDEIRRGMHPKDAALTACKEIARITKLPRLLNGKGQPNFNVKFYAVDKQGRHGGAQIRGGGRFAVCDGEGARLEDLPALFD